MSSPPDKIPDITTEPIKKVKSPIRGGFGTIATPANNIGGDSAWKFRRSSSSVTANTTASMASTASASSPTSPKGSSSGALFANLVNHKRGSTDAEAVARRASFHDQKPETGVFGSWWSKYTTGSK